MADASNKQLQVWIERLKSGDPTARKELVAHSCERLRRLTRKMLRDFPGVRRQEDSSDVLHNAVIRLLRALDAVPLESVAEFFRLAALQIRRELLDLARHYARHRETTAQKPTKGGEIDSDSAPPAVEANSASFDPHRLALWTEFHRQVEALPAEEREVFGLRWYHALTEADTATMLNTSRAKVKRWWAAARLRLQKALGGALPGSDGV